MPACPTATWMSNVVFKNNINTRTPQKTKSSQQQRQQYSTTTSSSSTLYSSSSNNNIFIISNSGNKIRDTNNWTGTREQMQNNKIRKKQHPLKIKFSTFSEFTGIQTVKYTHVFKSVRTVEYYLQTNNNDNCKKSWNNIYTHGFIFAIIILGWHLKG